MSGRVAVLFADSKPAALSEREALEMLAAARAADVHLAEALLFNYHPQVRVYRVLAVHTAC